MSQFVNLIKIDSIQNKTIRKMAEASNMNNTGEDAQWIDVQEARMLQNKLTDYFLSKNGDSNGEKALKSANLTLQKIGISAKSIESEKSNILNFYNGAKNFLVNTAKEFWRDVNG